VQSGVAYFALVIPPDFSATALPGTEVGSLELITSGGTSFTATLIGERFASRVAEELNDQMGAERWRVVLSSGRDARGAVRQLSEGVDAALSGSRDLGAGIDRALSGAQELTENQRHLAEGLSGIDRERLVSAIGEIQQHQREIADGLAGIDTARLVSAESQIAAGQRDLAEGLSGIDTARLVSAGAELHGNTAELARGLARHRIIGRVTGLPSAADLERLASGAETYQGKAEELAAGLDRAAAGARELAAGSASYESKIEELAAGLERAASGATALAEGTATYQSHVEDLAAGLQRASSGANDLADGGGRLVEGLGQAWDGSQSLTSGLERISNGLTEFGAALPSGGQSAEDLAASARVDKTDLAPVSSNGPAFAPYFMALSLWLGGVVSAFLFRFNVFPKSMAEKRKMAKIMGKGMIPGAITLASAILLGLTIHLLMQVPLADARGFYMVLLIGAVTYDSIIYALIRLLGDAGKLLAVVFLVLQLAAAGGPYPIELSPPFYQTISPYLPLSQVVRGLRASMFGSFNGDWSGCLLHMAPWFIAGIFLSHLAVDRFRYVDDTEYGSALDRTF
jgi:putative membrane protein